ncbi:DUF924 family protein [Shewanella gelidii]|uniref:Membrane protein n=1 Tax=Shewanella gelidii TaxID=1642821 RepID=A0A917JNB1_9GAMM|nr:DUF924 family protein [Shewanella gelidii]MCL1099289.1 DUF924 domain-containing protein [Shewanella gelidii]GGI77679.1 membrane protein [Shewanella gelidii]
MPNHSPTDVLEFWFYEIEPKQWWVKDEAFDDKIRKRFEPLLMAAKQGDLYTWRATAQGRLAEIIVLDQFSRNIYRDHPKSFASDGMALVLAQEAVAIQADFELSPPQVPFLYMPYMHSESKLIHQVAIQLFSREAAKDNLAFEISHKAIIDRFGRYPHRNAILGRESTVEEIEFLKQPGSGF